MTSPRSITLYYVSGALLLCALTACAGAPEQAYSGDPVEGRQVAQNLCASCHSIEPIGASPNAGAPPLRYVLERYNPDRLAQDLENSVSISHRRMPTFYFGENHARDVVAYLKTIQQQPPAP